MKSPHFFKYSVVCMLTTGALYSSPSSASPLTIDPPLDLGALGNDTSGYYYPRGMADNGSSVAGGVFLADGRTEAVVWSESNNKITGLGTLKSDNSGSSFALTQSANGRGVAGHARLCPLIV